MPASPNSGSLRVRLSHAIGLRSMDSNGYSGPYVKLTLGKETHKSEIVKKSLNPRWDKDYFFRGGFEQLVALPLQVHAWDYDRLSIRNDPLGNGSIDLRQLDLGSCQAVDCSVQLKDEQATPGEVFFTIQWQPNAGAAHPPPPPPPPAAHRPARMTPSSPLAERRSPMDESSRTPRESLRRGLQLPLIPTSGGAPAIEAIETTSSSVAGSLPSQYVHVAHESAKRNPLNDWSEDEVEKWLEGIDPKIAKAAKAAGVNGCVLQELDAGAWTELGVTVALRRCQLVAAVKQAAEGRDVATIPFEDTAPSRTPSSSPGSYLTPEEEEELWRLEAWKKGLDAGDKMAAEAAKKADKEAAEAKKKAQKEAKEARKKADKEAAKSEAKNPPAKKKAEKEAATIAARIADLKRHRIQIRCAIQNLNPHDFAKSQTFEALIKFEASWEDRSPILYKMDDAGYKLGDRIMRNRCTYNKFVILQHDGSENSELFTPHITFKNLAMEPKTKEEWYVAELPLMTTDGLPDDRC